MAFTENPTNWPDIVDECQEAGVSCCHGDTLYQYHPSSHFYRTICYCNHVITWIPTFNSSLFNITVKFYFVVHPPHSNTSGCICLLNIVHHSTMWTNTKVIRPVVLLSLWKPDLDVKGTVQFSLLYIIHTRENVPPYFTEQWLCSLPAIFRSTCWAFIT